MADRPAGRSKGEKLLQGDARLIKYPLQRITREVRDEEDLLEMREEYFVRPRAYPRKEIDPKRRLRDYGRLGTMRKRQKKPRVPAGWRDGPGAPGTLGPGGCAWYSVGPTNINGRVTSIAIDPSNHQNVFVATVGGIWRSRDGGRRWQRVSEEFLASVFASVAVNPGNGNEVLGGGGDPNYHGGAATGTGIWMSTSGGDPGTWSKVSPAALDGAVVYRLRFDPAAPHDVYAATSAGVYLGTHGGGTIAFARLAGFDAWTNDVAVDFSTTPRKVYAGVRSASASFAVGIWKYDGTSWQKRDSGIPAASGRTIALALAASSPNTLYAKIENGSNGRLLGVYKTTSGGEPPAAGNAWAALPTASVMDDSLFNATNGYSWYNSVLEVDPNDADRVYGGGLNIYRTTDGGATWNSVSGGADPSFPMYVHADHHAVAFDPTNTKIVFVGDDGGIFRSTDTSAATWHWNDVSHGMVITEFYRIATQQATATVIAGGSQDNGSEITFGNRTWYQFGGCDGADVAVDGQDSVTVYANCNGSLYERVNPVPGTPGAGSSAAVTFPAGVGWKPPVAADQALPGRALAAGNGASGVLVLKTTNGLAWATASPVLPAGASVTFFAIAPSASFQTYYVGVGGGGSPTIWRTTDGGTNWSTTATGLPNAWPNGGAVDWTNPSRAFAAFSGGAGIYMTTDTGATWTGIGGSGANALPTTTVTGVAVDPNDANTIYVSTWVGVFRGTITPGSPPTASWTPFDEGLPDGIDVNGICVNASTGILTIGTMGHGAYQRDVRPGITCPGAMLVVRDNVFDRGVTPSPSGVPDAEHPVPDPARPGFYKPNDDPAAEVYWWTSTDIRIDVPSQDQPQNVIANADHVEFETAPVEIATPPPGVLKDSNPIKGQPARAYVQVTNHGLQPASNVRVVALWADATAGLPLLPNDFWTTTVPAGSTTCGALDTSTGWNFVEPANPCRVIQVVNPALPEVVGFDWDVPVTAADHSCMLAMAESVDDPLDPSVRSTNEVRPWVFIPNNRQIGLRNLHLVTSSSPRRPVQGLEGLNVPNPNRRAKYVELVVARGDLAEAATLALLLPKGMAKVKGGWLERVEAELTGAQAKKAEKLGLDPSKMWVARKRSPRILRLPVPPGETITVGLAYDSGPKPQPGTASRFTILQRQGKTVLGGSTYVLRIPET
jgi:hypothetical protein